MADLLYLSTQFIASAVLFLLAGLLLALQFNNRVNRAFALLLFLLSLSSLFGALLHGIADPASITRLEEFYAVMQIHIQLAIPFAAVNFAAVYGIRSNRIRVPTRLAVGLLALAAQVSLLTNHCLLQCSFFGAFGPLAFLAQLYPLAYGFIGLYLVWTARREPLGPCERAAFTVGAAFLLLALLSSGRLVALGLMGRGPPSSDAAAFVAFLVGTTGIAPALAGLFLAWRISLNPTLRPRRNNLLALSFLALMTASLGFIPLVEETQSRPFPSLWTFLFGIWRLVLPAAVVYALVRHRLFDIDARVKTGLVRGTVLFVFLGLFFVVSKITENYLSSNQNILLGGASAGLALLALSPLEKLGRKVADRFLPNAKPVAAMKPSERLQLYADQAALIWRDGRMEAKERSILDHLRTRLEIPLEEAVRAEQAAASRSL